MEKHTSGPWMVSGGESKAGDLFVWEAGKYFGGHALARVYFAAPGDTKANAKLIAAAPELLEALRECARIGKAGVVQRCETGKPTWSALEEVAKIAVVAIARAKGE